LREPQAPHWKENPPVIGKGSAPGRQASGSNGTSARHFLHARPSAQSPTENAMIFAPSHKAPKTNSQQRQNWIQRGADAR
jgi:hypothetical protein